MSEEMEETTQNEAPPSKESKKEKPSPFLTALRDNQVAQAKAALMKTVTGDTDQTLGSIFDALENDSDGEYIMLEIFKSLTIAELIDAASSGGGTFVPPSASASDDDEDDELDDDDEFDDDGSLEDDEDDKPRKKKGKAKKDKAKSKKKDKAKKKAPPKKTEKKKSVKKSKKSSGGDLIDKPYQKAIMGCLKENRAYDDESGMSGEEIRDDIGGDADKLRANMAVLKDKEKVESYGKARGTKYIRIRKSRS